MLAIKLAIRNLMAAGIRTWLAAFVMSIAYVLLIFYNGMMDGWSHQSLNDIIKTEVGSGQFWHTEFNENDPLTYYDSHGPVPMTLQPMVEKGELQPLLLREANAYPDGRLKGVMIQGMTIKNNFLDIPMIQLKDKPNHIMIGRRMAKELKVAQDEPILIRWRDKHGTFDAKYFHIEIFETPVTAIDMGIAYLPLETLQLMLDMKDEATLLVAKPNIELDEQLMIEQADTWSFHSVDELTKFFTSMILAGRIEGVVMSSILLLIALLAIFDTMVLTIFKRTKEIGTYVALGMTQKDVVRIFTIEGAAHSLFAIAISLVWGAPILFYLYKNGLSLMGLGEQTGIMRDKVEIYYSFGNILFATIFIFISSAIVSYFPARKIAKLSPTLALKGRTNES